MKRGLIIITLILIMPSTFCQEVITTGSGVYLTEKKTIELAKIVTNEKRLIKKINEYHKDLTNLKKQIRELKEKYKASQDFIDVLNSEILENYNEISSLNVIDKNLSKKTKSFSFGADGRILLNNDLQLTALINASIKRGRFKYLFTMRKRGGNPIEICGGVGFNFF